ncbi:DEAD/DEAH box helicase family protein [Acinetobacter sp. ANC 4862]|uniref:type I restriction endonuclease subunit R n=1 Tax=Acinetobacter sp. ANC 4862 TaxID=2529849 RepID=UPI0010388D82|nr:DEAD/DEAH box helicase family protein [Acinetobacter sp. ANC 4862]TCH61795.1 DEAD/DEAH box helicase [Acinetobacter sp. ANC 4862]
MQSQNFEFLRENYPLLADLGALAEAVIYTDPGSTTTRLRSFAEEVVKSIYEFESLPRIAKANFADLLFASDFQNSITPSLLYKFDYLRQQGNLTAHGALGSQKTAFACLGTAFGIGQYLMVNYQKVPHEALPTFKNIEKNSATEKELSLQYEENQKLREELDKERLKNLKIEKISTELAQQKRARSTDVAHSLQWNEEKTRKFIIDNMVLTAGWDITDTQQVQLEFPVDMRDGKKGFVDYVFFDLEGQPIAVLEAKKASVSVHQGREQARQYADALEDMGYKRPVIFYSNGYETYIWDDARYSSYRQIYGFYSRDSLANLRFQHQYANKELERNNPDLSIVERPYQIEAIKTLSRKFQDQGRKALIIQATGTGKTRVAIALSELLIREHWAQRILFLCDRRELRKQADDAFKDFLRSEPRCVIGETNKVPTDSRIYIATYPGMMNRFAQFDVGFFDLIIADESHRSIYNRYKDLFDYFDALQVGLTATPVKFISRNTFKMFDCHDTQPTFEFGLDKAIENEPPYLVPFKVKDVTTEFLRDGIHYNQLSAEQQKQLEDDLGEDVAKQTTIKGSQIGKKIFSESTDTYILENLMENGIKDANGSLIGKTIIFAQRQDHAEHLEKLFCKLYPQHGARVCKVIHNKIHKVDSLITEFKEPNNDFRIAISVDMLDTGIDVPQVVNLVFAKPVMSWVKFWQMIGRGTRLCENLFGPGKDKKEFLIFDHYGNFKYFEEKYEEPEDVKSVSLLQSTFLARLNFAKAALVHSDIDGFEIATHLLAADINDLPNDSISVKKHLRIVHQLQQTQLIKEFSAATQHILLDKIVPLMDARVLKEKEAIAFDKLIAQTQESLIRKSSSYETYKAQVLTEISSLAVNIQAVRQKAELIKAVQTNAYWSDITVSTLEQLRLELRLLMQFKQAGNTTGGAWDTPTTTTQDGEVQIIEKDIKLSNNEAMLYRKKLKEILDQMIEGNTVLQKIRQQQPVEEGELQMLTSTVLSEHPNIEIDVLNKFYGRTAAELHLTIQEIVGLDPKAVEQHFRDFLYNHPQLTARQVQFLNLLQAYISQNGGIIIDKLYEAPFTGVHPASLDGLFTPDDVTDLIHVMKPFVKKQPPEQRIA